MYPCISIPPKPNLVNGQPYRRPNFRKILSLVMKSSLQEYSTTTSRLKDPKSRHNSQQTTSRISSIWLGSITLVDMIANRVSIDLPWFIPWQPWICFNFSGTSEDYTVFSVVKDLTNNIMYFRAHDYISIRSIHLNKLTGESDKQIPLEDTFENSVKDITEDFGDY